MKTIAIFGCGAAGKRAWTQLRHAYKVVSFLDNDADKQRSRAAGIPVADPAKYNYALVDHVFIASIYLDEILVQLLELGVPPEKIEYVGQEMLTKEFQSIDGSLFHKALYLPLRLLRATWK